jgi:hypothetical protein
MLKAGTDTGSLVNHLMSGTTRPAPGVGMGATILMWTDRKAATVVAVDDGGRRVTVQEDDVRRTDTNGMSESQAYECTPNPNGRRVTFKLGKRGWREVRFEDATRRWRLAGGHGLALGVRAHYHDFSF